MFSIVTPARNALPALKRCVGSIRGQADVELEHLVEDGASDDGSAAWLAQQSDLRWRSQADDGMYDAINKGWQRAHGDVLAWINADEQYLPGALSRVETAFAADPELDIVCGNMIVVDEDGTPLAARRETPFRIGFIRNQFLHIASCTMFFHRRLRDAGLLTFDTRYRVAGDMDLVLRLLSRGVRARHLRAYLALFGVDYGNLSASEATRTETEEIRLRHGASRPLFRRRFHAIARYIERLVRGQYLPVEVSYEYALDEIPNYSHRIATRLTGRFDINRKPWHAARCNERT